ncbi:hypothetical protein Q2T42_04395 [Leptolyngbya boryana CZ1]|uniref:Uncharacterized protein n=1 Tax=Leptolyngbya boryana CZ1 TaxID=3060204 RepID=A0AA96X7P7_LEPBY|nr:hypothetical protein [Leptolyngbya boryana]WNZ47075.1 hypothetical protein Q2T42_04395 [Leptolyngbya boryana CZ1]
MSFAAKATSDSKATLDLKAKVIVKSDNLKSDDRQAEKPDLEHPRDASWLKSTPTAEASEIEFSKRETPISKPEKPISKPAMPIAKPETTRLAGVTKENFLKTQSQASARQLLAEPSTSESSIAQASENTESLRQRLTIEPLTELRIPAYSPGSTVGVPSAFGANFGDAFIGLAFSNRRPRINESDGALSAGFGLGDSERALGLEVNANIGSLRRFGRNGDIGLKLHRALPGKAAIAIGLDEGIVWGEANRDTVSTFYGVASKIFDLRPTDQVNSLPLTLTLGVGGGRFRSFENIENRRGGVGVFASAGLRVVPQASAIASWTGQDLNLGVSYVPLKTTPLFLTFVVGNVLGRNDNNTLFSFGIGYGFNYAGYRY